MKPIASSPELDEQQKLLYEKLLEGWRKNSLRLNVLDVLKAAGYQFDKNVRTGSYDPGQGWYGNVHFTNPDCILNVERIDSLSVGLLNFQSGKNVYGSQFWFPVLSFLEKAKFFNAQKCNSPVLSDRETGLFFKWVTEVARVPNGSRDPWFFSDGASQYTICAKAPRLKNSKVWYLPSNFSIKDLAVVLGVFGDFPKTPWEALRLYDQKRKNDSIRQINQSGDSLDKNPTREL